MNNYQKFSKISSFISSACGLIVTLTGILALAGWVFKLSRLASFGADTIPMAPSTAELFIVFGFAIFIRETLPMNQKAQRISMVAISIVTLLSLILFIMSCLEIRPGIEHFGFQIENYRGGVAIGHISPLTAFCFLLAGISFLSLIPSSKSAAQYVRFAIILYMAGLLWGICIIFLLVYALGSPVLYSGMIIPPAINTVLCLTMIGITLATSMTRQIWTNNHQSDDVPTIPFFPFTIFVILVVGIVSSGYLYYVNYETHFRTELEKQLSAIAELKVAGLTQWRLEQLESGYLLSKNLLFIDLVRRFQKNSNDRDAGQKLRTWIKEYQTHNRYDLIRIIDTSGTAILSSPAESTPPSEIIIKSMSDILKSGKITLQDFHRHDRNQKIYLTVMAPIIDIENNNLPLGVVTLRIDPEIYLYPYIQRWPIPSKSAETLIVRREENEVIFLNELKFKKNVSLNLRIPLNKTEVPAVRAALGERGIIEGVDYRNVKVIADIRPVPDSPWFIVSKMDISEVYGPIRERLGIMVILISVVLFGTSISFIIVWRQRDVRYYIEKKEEIQQINATLEKKVAERTAQLEAFAYSVSHDLRTPLRAISGFSEIIVEDYYDKLDEKGKNYLNRIQLATERMSKLIDAMLRLSKLSVAEMIRTTVNLSETARTIIGESFGANPERKFAFTCADEIKVIADEALMRIALYNLLDNAWKYTEKNDDTRIEFGRSEIDGEIVYFVKDNGAGFDMAYKNKLFVAFQRLHLDEEFKGFGIGLTTVHRIIKRHGGRVWAESEPGKGATFYFTLPPTETADENKKEVKKL